MTVFLKFFLLGLEIEDITLQLHTKVKVWEDIEGRQPGFNMSADRERELAEQLAQLRWKRSQNERSIKRAIESTRVLQKKDTIFQLTAKQNFDKSLWVTSVLKDELTRPLILSDSDVISNYNSDKKIQDRLLKYSHQQLQNIDRLAHTVVKTGNKSEGAMRTKREQIDKLQFLKEKLKSKIKTIEGKKPYQNFNLAS